jgi:protease I
MELYSKTKKVVMIIASSDFRDEEYQEPRALLEKAGYSITVASSSVAEAKGMFGLTVKPDILISKVNVDQYDAIVFVGGSGAEKYFDDPEAHRIAKEAVAKGKVLAAICIAPNILANAGLLKNKNATCFYPKNIKDKGAKYVSKPVVQDGKIVTGSGPQASVEFGTTIVKLLESTN